MKKNIKKIIILTLILIFSHSAFYLIGSVITRQAMLSSISIKFKRKDSMVNLGRYIEYRYIAVQLKLEKYDNVKCTAELGASAMLDDLKLCLASNDCNGGLPEKVLSVAPELLEEAPLEFKYRDKKRGIRSCE